MEKPEDGSPQPHPKERAPWERPAVKCAGTISLLVRAGTAEGKLDTEFDGDGGQFLARGRQ